MNIRKSQIFMFDMILSFVILVLVLAMSFNYYMTGTKSIDAYTINRQILDGFTNTKINTLNDVEVRDMFSKNMILNVENTVAQQVIEFYESPANHNYSRYLTRVFVEDYIDKQMNFNITLENDTMVYVLYNITNRAETSFEDAELTSVTQRRIFAFKNTTDFYGPYIFKIKIWK